MPCKIWILLGNWYHEANHSLDHNFQNILLSEWRFFKIDLIIMGEFSMILTLDQESRGLDSFVTLTSEIFDYLFKISMGPFPWHCSLQWVRKKVTSTKELQTHRCEEASINSIIIVLKQDHVRACLKIHGSNLLKKLSSLLVFCYLPFRVNSSSANC